MSEQRWQARLWQDARAALPDHVWRFVTAGARDEISLQESLEAWSHVRLYPRVLRDVRRPDAATALLGLPVPSPVAIAPTSMQRLAHPGGELAMAQAAAEAGSLVVVSSNAGTRFEELGTTGAAWWLQAYATADRSLVAPVFEEAARAGARAIVLTVDTPVPGTKYDIDEAAFGDLTEVYGLNHPQVVRGRTPGAEHAQDLTAADIAWLHDLTGLPIVVKGVLRADDAQRCVEAGAAGVWVSNHGGRQLDRSVSTCAALPAVGAAVSGQAEVYVDGGIRSGLDVLTALALGADGVFCGRTPYLALAAGGAERVVEMLDLLHDELLDALRMSGCARLQDARGLASSGTPEPPTGL
ncbi:alpha-hydroxy acid oxidase [Nocardioides sp.]|jgi:4-hydroxymandelate oxidase|uniref:alpha-hydroxy acid oxidase n=1 Tax=Nocardioides sp. TaxID=35761 RepID=UPI002610E76C|nr:alpha-hydroxy acid oxidase [Nocardioides sp.]